MFKDGRLPKNGARLPNRVRSRRSRGSPERRGRGVDETAEVECRGRDDKLARMDPDRRAVTTYDRRAHPRGGRRDGDNRRKPWYMRRRLWLAAASVLYVGWRRVRTLGRRPGATDRHVAA